MMVRLTELTGTDTLDVPAPFDVILAAGGTKDMPIHVRDIVEYRSNPARVDNLREIEQMVKDGKLLITPLSRVPSDMDLEEMLLVFGGGIWNQKGIEVVGAPAPAVTIVFPVAMPGPYRIKGVILEGVGGAQPFEATNLIGASFDVTFAAPWGPGQIHWEVEFPV